MSDCYLCLVIANDLHHAVVKQERRRQKLLPTCLDEIERVKQDRAEHERLEHDA